MKSIFNLVLALMLVFCCSLSAIAQNVKATGVIIDSEKEPLIGASVVVKGTSNGTITNFDGEFTIEAPKGSILEISYVGYDKKEVTVVDSRLITVALAEAVNVLDDIVVVGYGTQSKPNLTGAVGVLSGEELNSRPISSVSQGLQGMLSGVTVVNSSGQPGGSNASIQIRGVGTIGNTTPLVLIDGVEGDINTLNPEDIESVSVLKDAASAAIYGARGANGVLLITTKRITGKEIAPQITFNGYYGFQTPTRLPKMASGVDYMILENEAKRNVGTAESWTQTQIDALRNGTANPNNFANTDWVSEVLESYAPQQNYNLNVTGQGNNMGYLLSYGFLDQQGLTVGNSSSAQRHNIRLKLSTNIAKIVDVTGNLSYITGTTIAPPGGFSSSGGAIYNAMRIQPNSPVRYTNGEWAYGGGNTNPVATITDGGNQTTNYGNLSGIFNAKVTFLKGWDATVTYNFTQKNSLTETLRKTINFYHPETGDVQYSYNSPNSVANSDNASIYQSLIAQSNFDFKIKKHRISGVAGFSQEWYVSKTFAASRQNLVSEVVPNLGFGSLASMSNSSSAATWAIRSGFARVNYNYNDRYLLEANLRYDLTSRFSSQSRGGWFPSFSAAWRITEEKFMAPTRGILDNLKLRASWGLLGNQYVGSNDYPYLGVISETGDSPLIGTQPTNSYTQTSLSNTALHWEKIDMLDIGLDITMLNNRLSFTFDWYTKNTNDILLRLTYPSVLGITPTEENLGVVNNTGWEFEVSWRDKIGKFSYGIAANLSDVQNKIVNFGDLAASIGDYSIRRVGDPIDAFYGYVADGLMTEADFDQTLIPYGIYTPTVPVIVGNSLRPGDVKYKDLGGAAGWEDGKISPEYDRQVIGSAIPRYTYSIKGDLGWNGIDFSFYLQGVGQCDGYLLGSARHAFVDMASYPQQIHLDRYSASNPNPNASYPRLTYNTSYNQDFSTFWLEDASYLRLKNVQLGYTLPDKITQKARLSRCRLYVSADNLFTATNFFYAYDPETPISKGGYYPQVKTVVFGLSVTFN